MVERYFLASQIYLSDCLIFKKARRKTTVINSIPLWIWGVLTWNPARRHIFSFECLCDLLGLSTRTHTIVVLGGPCSLVKLEVFISWTCIVVLFAGAILPRVAINANTIYYHWRSLIAAFIICCECESNLTTANTRALDVYSTLLNRYIASKRANIFGNECHRVVPKLATIVRVTTRVSLTLCVYEPAAPHTDVAGYKIGLVIWWYLPIAHLITARINHRCLKLRARPFNIYSHPCAPDISIAIVVAYLKYQLVSPINWRPPSN